MVYRFLSFVGCILYIFGCRKNGYDFVDYMGKFWVGYLICRNYKCKNVVVKCMNNREKW